MLAEYFEDKTSDTSFIPTATNAALYDTNEAQKLTQEDIARLKHDMSGKDVIKKLADNSATFAGKTEFSVLHYC